MPKVSIIIPAYNVEKYIPTGIESACAQTETDIEIIIVDDGSTDGTWNIIQDYASQDNRILPFHQDNAGVSSARNKALELASGEYVLFLDSDDWLEKDAVEMLLRNADPSGRILVCSDYYIVKFANGERIREQRGKDNKTREYTRDEALCFVGQIVPIKLTSACYRLYSRHVIAKRNLRFDTSVHQGEDGLFVFEYLLGIDKMKIIPQPLWNILKRSDSACGAGYTKRWNSALVAIDKMLLHEDELSPEAVFNIKAYKGERAIWLMKGMLRVKDFDRADFYHARKQLKECCRYFLSKNIAFKTYAKCLLFLCAPVPVLEKMLMLSDNYGKMSIN